MKGRVPFCVGLMLAARIDAASSYPTIELDRTASGGMELTVHLRHLSEGGRVDAWVRDDAGQARRRVVVPFDLGGWESGLVHIPLRVNPPDPAVPVRVDVERILLDTPVGIDTVSSFGPLHAVVVPTPAPTDAPARSCADGFVEPLWRPGDGDVLVVSCDALYGSLMPLIDALSSRGFRCARSRLSLILRDYGGEDPAGAIRDAVADASRAFATRPLALILVGPASEDQPQNDLLPTLHGTYEHEFMGYYDRTFAEDGAFGDLMVGRIPARTSGELASYVEKLAAYGSQEPSSRVHFVVGDAALNRDNSDRRRATQELLGLLDEGGILQGTSRYASAYAPLDRTENRERALSDLEGDLAQGVGLLAVFGNNVGPTNVVHAWEVPPGPRTPWLQPADLPTTGRLPIALFGTCLNGAFDEDGHFPGFDSPAETWVREPGRGAIAVVAPSHLTTFFDDWEITGQFLRRLSRGDRAPLGAILAGARESLMREWTRGPRSLACVRMMNLIGDPLLAPRLDVEQTRLAGSFELSGSWPSQNTMETARGWTTADCIPGSASARIVDGTDGALPVEGRRLMRLSARFHEGAYRRGAAWKLFECDLRVAPGAVLRAWTRLEEGEGRFGIDAVTESGLLLSECLLDERGIQADPAHYRSMRGRWNPVTIRLDGWAGERIRAVYVRYEESLAEAGGSPEPGTVRPLRSEPMPPGTFVGCVDAVSIEPAEPRPFLDGAFEGDLDEDGRPDAWTAPWPASIEGKSACAAILLDDGDPSIVLSDDIGPTPGLSQRIVAEQGRSRLQLGWDARSPDGGTMRVGLADPLTGELFDAAWIGPVGDPWSGQSADLALPSGRPVLLEFRPSAGTVRVRALRLEEERPAGGGTSSLAVPSASIEPNPTSGPIRIRWMDGRREVRSIELFDASGRRVASWQPRQGIEDCILSRDDVCGDDGRPLAAGIYFVRMRTGRESVTRRLHLLR